MMSVTNTKYISNVEWLQSIVQGQNLILCDVSALEYLELFNGYMDESKIQVYAKSKGEFDNIEYNIVETFNNIEYFNSNGVLCTTINQTINDMLSNYDQIDELAFLEALSNIYFDNNESFDTLKIKPENLITFNKIKKYAVDYYSED